MPRVFGHVTDTMILQHLHFMTAEGLLQQVLSVLYAVFGHQVLKQHAAAFGALQGTVATGHVPCAVVAAAVPAGSLQ
jgi:hypothetical protein